MEEADIKSGRINDQLGTQLESISAQVEANLERGRNAVAEWKTMLTDRSREYLDATDQYVRDEPWKAAGIAAAAGLVLGLLMTRR